MATPAGSQQKRWLELTIRAWNQVEEWLDCRPVKQLAQHELARRGLAV
jgi:hypothetical protein